MNLREEALEAVRGAGLLHAQTMTVRHGAPLDNLRMDRYALEAWNLYAMDRWAEERAVFTEAFVQEATEGWASRMGEGELD